MRTVSVVVPGGIDDPARPSGGNRYDRRVLDGLTAVGWQVRELTLPGPWPRPDAAALSRLAWTVARVPDGGVLLVDGLIASAGGAVLEPESARLRLVVLVHMPFGGVEVAEDGERAVLERARAVVTTSAWTREWLLGRYRLPPERVHVARPGADPGEAAPGSRGGGRLLCVAAVVPHKGHDVLVDALGGIPRLPWTCTVVGPLDRDPRFVERLRRRALELHLHDRIRCTGPLDGAALRREYRNADLLVHPSRLEAYGMVVAEALAVGLPVVATAVGGVAEALGSTTAGPPGLLVPPDDADALGEALGAWLRNEELRTRLRRAASVRRTTVAGWADTTRQLALALDLALDRA